MKKTFAVLLAITMLFAVCVPAFAVDKTMTETDPTTDSAVIRTNTDAYVNTNGYYSVTFPAETPIPWSNNVDTHTPLQCNIYANLMNNKKLNVTVAAAADTPSVMKDASNNTIPFTLGTAEYKAEASFVNNKEWTPTVDILGTDWNNAPIGEYTANLTFTVTVA